jgi:hypothetical protein
MFYTVMGYNFDQDDSYDSTLDEVKGTIHIVNNTSHGRERETGGKNGDYHSILLRLPTSDRWRFSALEVRMVPYQSSLEGWHS